MKLTEIIILLSIILICSCSQGKNEKSKITTKPSLSREERVKEIPYRNQLIKDSEIDAIKNDVKLICSQYEADILTSAHLLIGLKKTNDRVFIPFDEKWSSSIELTKFLNEAWRNKDFTATVALFSSSSRNALNDDIKKILVIELEYEKYTGKWTAFFDYPLHNSFYNDNFELQYFERN